MAGNNRTVVSPALPNAPREYTKSYLDSFNNILRLYFNRVDNILGILLKESPIMLKSYRVATANTTLRTTDYLINYEAGAFTVQLLKASNLEGQVFVVKNSGTGAGSQIIVAAEAGQTIDGAATVILSPRKCVSVMSTGTGWIITSEVV